MSHSNWLAGALWLWLALQQPASPSASVSGASDKDLEHQAASQAFFSNGPIAELHLAISPASIESLKKESRRFVRAQVADGTNIYAEVGVHLKGNSTFLPIDGEKPSFTLKFNLYTAKQRFHGLNKVSLNNSLHDPSYLNEPLCTGLFHSLGVPVGRVSHARVWLNGRYLGFYILVEGMTKDFLKLNFKSSDGNLYEANAEDIDEELEQINGTERGQGDLKALLKATREADANQRWEHLHRLLDVERFISMMAGDVLMSHWDGYYNDANNYRLYHDTATGQMVMIPHGLDNMFQVADVQWRPELHSILGKALLQTSQGQDLYRERFWTAFEGPFRTELLLARIERIISRLRPAIGVDGTNAVQRFDKEAAIVRKRVVERMNFLAGELATLAPRLSFEPAGVAKLAGWQMKVESGEAKLDMEQMQNGQKPALHIKGSRGAKAAWLTRVVLDPGKYVFRGEARSLGVVPLSAEPESGAGLRRSGAKAAKQLLGDAGWGSLEYTFEVRENGSVVDLLCELRGEQGEVWFDADSLRLVRVK